MRLLDLLWVPGKEERSSNYAMIHGYSNNDKIISPFVSDNQKKTWVTSEMEFDSNFCYWFYWKLHKSPSDRKPQKWVLYSFCWVNTAVLSCLTTGLVKQEQKLILFLGEKAARAFPHSWCPTGVEHLILVFHWYKLKI